MCQTQFSTKVVINKAFSLGKKGAKPRLLKISLSSDTEKTTILKNSTKLRSSDASPVYKSIFITPDLTPKEQEHNKQLRAELRTQQRGPNFPDKKWEDSAEEAIATCCTDNNNTPPLQQLIQLQIIPHQLKILLNYFP